MFIIDDMITDETLDKRRQSLLELAISGRHRQHSLWLLTQSYMALPKNLRRQIQLFVWYPYRKIEARDLTKIKDQLKREKHACLYGRLEHPKDFKVFK